MQNDFNDDLAEAIARRERRLDELADEYDLVSAELTELKYQRLVERKRRRREQRRKFRIINGAGAAVAGAALTAAHHVRDRPGTYAAAVLALATAAVFGSLIFRGPSPEQELIEPPRAIGTPTFSPSPLPASPTQNPAETPSPTAGPEAGQPPEKMPPDIVIDTGQTLDPTVTPVPPQPTPSPTQPTPSPSPSPTRTDTPSPTPTLPPPPEPTPTPTPTPTRTPNARDPLICLDVDLVLDVEACLDAPLLDRLLGGLDGEHAAEQLGRGEGGFLVEVLVPPLRGDGGVAGDLHDDGFLHVEREQQGHGGVSGGVQLDPREVALR